MLPPYRSDPILAAITRYVTEESWASSAKWFEYEPGESREPDGENDAEGTERNPDGE